MNFKLKQKMTPLITLLLLAGCATKPEPLPVTYCSWVKPITVSRLDTEDTIKQVAAHDKAYDENMGSAPQ